MAYVKHGTGKNDYKKGNRTRGKDRRGNLGGNPAGGNLEPLEGSNADKQNTIEHYKEVARQLAGVIKYGQEYALTLKDNLEAYIIDSETQRKPLTIAGMVRASGMGTETYYRYREGEADHLLYMFMDTNNIDYSHEGEIFQLQDGREVLLVRLSHLIKQAELAVQEQRETACSSNRGNPAGNIFLLKAQQGFQDTPVSQQTNNSLTVNVASLGEAREALQLLGQ